MWNLIAIALVLVVTIASYVIAMWVTRLTNDRGDEILHGLVKGIPMSSKDRWLMQFTQWLPYVTFLIAFLLISAVGDVQIARIADDPRLLLPGYMSTGFLASGALFLVLAGVGLVVPRLLSVLRQNAR